LSKPSSSTPIGARAWLAVCAGLAAGSLVAWWLPSAWLDWQPARAASEPWRLVTAAWVHWSDMHLLANLAGAAVVAALGVVARLPARAALALAFAWPATHAALWIEPALAHYGGASGVLHAAVAVVACWLVFGGEGRDVHDRLARWIGAAIGLGLVVKIGLEAPWAGPLAAGARTWDIAVVPLAHASGALAGAVAAVVALVVTALPVRQARRHPR